MTTQPPNRCQQAALLFAGVSCGILALGSWSPDASAHPHVPGSVTVPHTHGETTHPQSTDQFANPALWLPGWAVPCWLFPHPVVYGLKGENGPATVQPAGDPPDCTVGRPV